MKFFRLIRNDVAVFSLLAEIQRQEDLWVANTSRQDRIAVQQHTNTIFIRNAASRPDLQINENQESRFTRMSKRFPEAVNFMMTVAKEMNCQLSRATIVRLGPRCYVGRHTDAGSYYLIRDRYHLVLHSPAGSILTSGDETVSMRVGELWWFNNKEFHEARNDSDEWRIHYIFDLLPRAYEHLARNPMLINNT